MLDKRQEVVRQAAELYEKELDWVSFFRAVLGKEGIVRQMYRDAAELADFEKSQEYQSIQSMLARLRDKDIDGSALANEPTRVITVRLPKSLHESLKAEAHDKHTSMNKLCISKLLQVLDEMFSGSNGQSPNEEPELATASV